MPAGFARRQPEAAGVFVSGSGGVRKLRRGSEDRGKRDGLRVINSLRSARGELWMLTDDWKRLEGVRDIKAGRIGRRYTVEYLATEPEFPGAPEVQTEVF